MVNSLGKRRTNQIGMWKMGAKFYHEDDWDIADRQAEDKARAEEKAAIRKKNGERRGEKNKKTTRIRNQHKA